MLIPAAANQSGIKICAATTMAFPPSPPSHRPTSSMTPSRTKPPRMISAVRMFPTLLTRYGDGICQSRIGDAPDASGGSIAHAGTGFPRGEEVVVGGVGNPRRLACLGLGAAALGRYAAHGIDALDAGDPAERARGPDGLRGEKQPGDRVGRRRVGTLLH